MTEPGNKRMSRISLFKESSYSMDIPDLIKRYGDALKSEVKHDKQIRCKTTKTRKMIDFPGA